MGLYVQFKRIIAEITELYGLDAVDLYIEL